MADEFIKGLGIFTAGGLGWMVLAGWYRTQSFESTTQLVGGVTSGGTIYDSIGVLLMDGLFWFTLLGILTFWVLIPVGRQTRAAIEERRA